MVKQKKITVRCTLIKRTKDKLLGLMTEKVKVDGVYLLASALRVGTTPLGGDSGRSGGGKNLKEPPLW